VSETSNQSASRCDRSADAPAGGFLRPLKATRTALAVTGLDEFSVSLACATKSVPQAQDLVKSAMHAWDLGQLIEAGVCVVSALFENAATHTSSRTARVSISRQSGSVRISVADKSRISPQKPEGDASREGSCGLARVEALTERWGTEPRSWGKVVFGELLVRESGP
jgi:hypothetical protein